jgi:hypothetical protein
MPTRRSDRWLTPAVLVALVLAATVVVLAVLAAVTYLVARGFDPAPVVQLAGTMVAAVSALGTFVVQLVSRRTVTKVERQTGRLASGVGDVLDELDATRGRHAPPDAGRPALAAPEGDHGQVTAEPRSQWRGPADSSERYADSPEEDLRDTAWFRQ